MSATARQKDAEPSVLSLAQLKILGGGGKVCHYRGEKRAVSVVTVWTQSLPPVDSSYSVKRCSHPGCCVCGSPDQSSRLKPVSVGLRSRRRDRRLADCRRRGPAKLVHSPTATNMMRGESPQQPSSQLPGPARALCPMTPFSNTVTDYLQRRSPVRTWIFVSFATVSERTSPAI